MLATVTGKVDYLTVAVVPTRVDPRDDPSPAGDRRLGDGWLECADLIVRPEILAETLAATDFGTDDAAVRASLFCQGYAFRVASVVLGPYALGLPSPDVGPANVVVRTGAFGVGAVGVHSGALDDRDAATIAADLLDGHLAGLIGALRARVAISDRLLWADVASACARVVRAVEGAGSVRRSAIRERSEAFVATAPMFAGVGAFASTESGWVWRRASSAGGYCDDCNMTDSSHGGNEARPPG